MTEPEDRDAPTENVSTRQVEFQLSGRHLALGLIGLFVLAAALFLLGRWSERKAHGEPEISEVEEVAPDSPAPTPAAGAPKELTFYETLGRKGAPGLQESPKPAAKEAPAELPAAPSPRAEKPAPAAASPAEGEIFRVQVASTRDAASARRLARRLETKGYPVRIDESPGEDGRTQYKVRVGSYREREPAEALVERIRTEERIDAWIVKVQG